MSHYTEPHWGRAALLLIDLQRDFLDGGAAPVSGTSQILPQAVGLAAAFRDAGRPIAHVVRLYPPGGSDIDLVRREAIEEGASIVAPGSEGAELPEGLLGAPTRLRPDLLLSGQFQQVGAHEVVLFKPRWSAFHRTDLERWLEAQGCDTVVVAGCNLPNCPRAALIDASQRDLRTVLVHDAVSQVTDERLADLAAIGVHLADADEVRSALTEGV